jgi:tetratricopeptide (TPR) repeat protein
MQPQIARDSEPSAGALRWAAALVIALAAIVVYRGTLTAPLIYDDRLWITWNPSIQHLASIAAVLSPPPGSVVFGRPVLSLSLALNYAVSGDKAWSYHLANLGIHVLAALVLFGIVSRTLALRPGPFSSALDRTAASFAVALLWVLHPLQTESVTYVIQRAESLMGLFYLLVLYCFIRGARSGEPRAWNMLSIVACLLGMATKEVMVTAPLIVLAYDRTFVAGSFREALRLRKGLYLGLAFTWAVPRFLALGLHGRGVGYGLGYSWIGYGLTECWVVPHYLLLALWPHPLVFDYGTDIVGTLRDVLPSACVLAVLLGVTVIAFVRRSALGFAGVWFFLILAPTSSIVPVAFQPMAEHRVYLSLAAVVAVLVAGAWAAFGRRSLLLFLAAAAALGTATLMRNRDYRTEATIWADTVRWRPQNPRAHLALGSALATEWRNQEAAAQFGETLRIDPGDFQARRNLGMAFYHMGRPEDALAQYRAIAPPTPDSAALHYDIGLALDLEGRTKEAIGEYTRAVQLDPVDAEARNNLGSALFRSGRDVEAVIQYGRALALSPGSARIHFNLALALTRMGGVEKAMAQYREAIRLEQGYAEAHNNLGNLLEQTGDTAAAVAQYEDAVRERPDYAAALANLARLGVPPPGK